jgi:hypothetical protein
MHRIPIRHPTTAVSTLRPISPTTPHSASRLLQGRAPVAQRHVMLCTKFLGATQGRSGMISGHIGQRQSCKILQLAYISAFADWCDVRITMCGHDVAAPRARTERSFPASWKQEQAQGCRHSSEVSCAYNPSLAFLAHLAPYRTIIHSTTHTHPSTSYTIPQWLLAALS